MASKTSIAIRKEAAIAAISAATGAEITVRAKDPRLKEAMLLEAIADAMAPADTEALATLDTRKEAAIAAIVRGTGRDLTVKADDPQIEYVMLLEAIADMWVLDTTADAMASNIDYPIALPSDFPGRAELIAAGYTTVEGVDGIEDLTVITGIGKATAVAITEALASTTDDGVAS